MRAIMVDVPEGLLEERRKAGLDVWDEVWEGVLHMVPPASGVHQRLGTRLVAALLPLADAKGLVASYETGLYRPGDGEYDYRVPDLVVARPENTSEAGVEGRAELVVEIRSQGDETYDKLDFYADLQVQEVLVIEPETCAVELFALRDGRLHIVLPDTDGSATAKSLDVSFSSIEAPGLRLAWPGGSVDIAVQT